MKEIISSILEAESKANELLKSAADKAKSIILEADAESEKLKNDAVLSFKAHRKDVILNAEKDAESAYGNKLAEGKLDAAKLVDSVKGGIDEISDEIVKDLIGL